MLFLAVGGFCLFEQDVEVDPLGDDTVCSRHSRVIFSRALQMYPQVLGDGG
jgi:hypothetical protein